MSSPFAITAVTNFISLNSQQQGQVSFTVSNMTAKALHSRAHIVSQPEIAAFLTIQGEAERDIAATGSQQYIVLVAVPPGTQAGDYTFHLNVVDQANPDDDFSEGPTIKFSVAASVPTPKPFPWWIVAIVAGAVILLGGGIYGIIHLLNPPPVYCLQASSQSLMITGIETGTDPLAQKVTVSNCGSAGNWTSTVKTNSGGAWLTSITPSSGVLGAGGKQVISVSVTDNPKGGGSLKAGIYTGTVIFTLGGRSLPVSVTFSVQPAPSADPTTLILNTFGIRTIRMAEIVLTNYSSAGVVSAEVSTDDGQNWLSTNLTNGNAISEKGKLTITITSQALYIGGGQTGHIKFIVKTSSGTASVTVTVRLNIIHS